MPTPNRTNTQVRDGQIIVGITKDLQNTQGPLLLGGQAFTPASLIAVFSRIDAANQIAAAKAQWQDQVKKYIELSVTVDLVARGLKQYVMNAYGATSPLLADFGFTPPKRTPQTVEQKTQARCQARGDPQGAQHARQKAEGGDQRHGATDRAGDAGRSGPRAGRSEPGAVSRGARGVTSH